MNLFFPLVLLLSTTLLVPSVSSQDYVVATCNTWVTITDGWSLSGAASTSVKVLPNKDYQTVATLSVFGEILLDGVSIEGDFPAHVHALACSDNDAGGHYQFVPGGAVDDENEIWLSFTNTPAQSLAEHEPAAEVSGFNSIVIHSPIDGAKALCCDLDKRTYVDPVYDDASGVGRVGVGGGVLIGMVVCFLGMLVRLG